MTLAISGLAAVGLNALRIKELARWGIGFVVAADLFLTGSGRPMNVVSVKQEPGVTRESFDGSSALLEGVRSYVSRDHPPSRIDTTADASTSWSTSGPVTLVPAANGVSPLALENIIQLRLILNDGWRSGWYYPVEKLESPILDLLNVRYLIATGQGAERARALPRFRHQASLPGNELFENLTAMPRFFIVHQVRPVASLAEAKGLIERREIDFRQTAITQEVIDLPQLPDLGGTDEVQVVDYSPASLELFVRSRGRGLLVMSETDYPGWTAWIDGRPVRIHLVNIAFRGVVIPDGPHHVRLAFRPVILPVSLAVSLATVVLLIFLVWKERSSASLR